MIFARGECVRCGEIVTASSECSVRDSADLYLTVPGRGVYAGKIFKAELIHKNAMICAELQRAPKLS